MNWLLTTTTTTSTLKNRTRIVPLATAAVVSTVWLIFFVVWKKKNRDAAAAAAAGDPPNTKKRQSSSSSWPIVPGRWPLFGNIWQIGTLSRLYEQIYLWADEYGTDCGVFEFALFSVPFLVVCRYDTILQILEHRSHGNNNNNNNNNNNKNIAVVYRSCRAKSVAHSIGAQGLFAAEGYQWQLDRRWIAPALNRKNLRLYFLSQRPQCITLNLLQKWSHHSIVPIHDDFHRLAIDTLSMIIHGPPPEQEQYHPDNLDIPSTSSSSSPSSNHNNNTNNNNNNNKHQTTADIMALLDLATTRMFSPFAYWKIPFIGPYLDGGEWIRKRLVRKLNQILAQHDNKNNNNNNNNNTTHHSNKTFLVDKLISLHQQMEQHMPRERLIGQLLTLYLGGSDTVATLLTTAFWLIATNPELQNDLYHELCQVLGTLQQPQQQQQDDDDEKDDDEKDEAFPQQQQQQDWLEQLPLFRSFFWELCRCHGPSAFVFLEAAQDVPFLGHFIPRGRQILLLTRLADVHGQIPGGPNGETPDQFCPQRWFIQGSFQPGPILAFGHGLRICPGKELAEWEVIHVLVQVLHKFQISLPPQQQEQPTPLNQVQIGLKPR